MRYLLFVSILLVGLLGSTASRAAWQEEWERTVKAAKKEGRVAMFGPTGTDRRDALVLPFQKKFGIKVDYLGGRASGIPPRISAERGARRYLWDFVVAGAQEVLLHPMKILEPLEPAFILPEVKNKKNWRGGDFEFLDPQRSILVISSYQRSLLFVNSKEVDAKEFKSYRDLLNPKWKGKIVTDDPRKPGPGQATFAFFYQHPDLGPAFIRALAKQKLLILKNYGQEIDHVGSGKYPVGLGLSGSMADQRIRQGVPIVIVDTRQMKEGSDVSPGIAQLGLFNKAPHPNAAKVYINWLLSKEGQIPFVKATGYISKRLDVPTDHAPAWSVPQPGAVKTYGIGPRKLVIDEVVPFLRQVLGR